MERGYESKVKPLLEEQETIIRIDRLSNTAEIYTSDSRHMNKFDKLVEKNPDEWKFVKQDTCDGDVTGKFYRCPVKYVSFRSKIVKRELTEEQKEEVRERLKRAREHANA